MRSFIPAYRRSAFLFGSLLLLALSVPAGAEEAEAPEQVWDSIRASVRAGRTDEALERLERYAQSFPQDREACYYLAMLRWRRGDVSGASEAYRRLLALDPHGPFASEARQWLERQASSATGSPAVEPAGASPSPAPSRRPSPTPLRPLATPTPLPSASASAGVALAKPSATPSPRATVFWPVAASPEPARPSPTRTPSGVQSAVPTPSVRPTQRPQPAGSSAPPAPSVRPSGLPTVTPAPSVSPSALPSATPPPSAPPSPLPSATSAPRASATPAPKGASPAPSPRSGATGKAWLAAQPLGRGGRARSANPPNGFLKAADGTFEFRPPVGFRLLDEGERSDEWHLLFGAPAQPGEASPPTLLIVWREVPELLRLRPEQRAARERQLLAEEAASYGSQTSMGVRFGVPCCQVVQQMGAWQANTSLFFRYGRLYALTYGGTGARLGTYRAVVDDALETLRFFQ